MLVIKIFAFIYFSPVIGLFSGCCKGELEDSVKLLVKVIRKASVVNSGLNFEVFLHKIDGIAEYERVDLLDGVSKLQKELFLEAEMGDINLRSALLSVLVDLHCIVNWSVQIELSMTDKNGRLSVYCGSLMDTIDNYSTATVSS